jgi:tyrosine-specific transport protein
MSKTNDHGDERRRRRLIRRSSSDDAETTSTTTTVASQAALIAGTTIGGGFLSLPAATAPCGAGPATLGLIGVWLYLLGSALSLSNAIFLLKNKQQRSTTTTGNHILSKLLNGRKDDDDEEIGISLSSLITNCFGQTAGSIGGLLFLLLITTTLVAQLSKVGTMVEMALPFVHRGLATCFFSVVIATLCLVCERRQIEIVNDALTATMVGSFIALVGLAGAGGWSSEGLQRSDFHMLLPKRNSPWAIPIFIQLLIYNEVVPLVASRLNDEDQVRRAILIGSSIPLIMCLVWSIVALGLVPYDASLMMSGVIYDPLSKLGDIVLARGGSIGRVFLASVNILAGSAICTTVIGSILASVQYYKGLIPGGNVCADVKKSRTVFLRMMLTHILAIAPSSLIAICGSSDLYYRAISFAGEFPCTLLYGLLSALCNIRLRVQSTTSRWIDNSPHIILALISLSILIVGNISKLA